MWLSKFLPELCGANRKCKFCKKYLFLNRHLECISIAGFLGLNDNGTYNECSDYCLLCWPHHAHPRVCRSYHLRLSVSCLSHNPQNLNVYLARYCHQCLCEIIAAEMSPDLAPSLCPACPDLDICPSTESKTSLLSLIGKFLGNWNTRD